MQPNITEALERIYFDKDRNAWVCYTTYLDKYTLRNVDVEIVCESKEELTRRINIMMRACK